MAETSKDDELDLLGDEDVESFAGFHADLEDAADNLFASPPRPYVLKYCLENSSKNCPTNPRHGFTTKNRI